MVRRLLNSPAGQLAGDFFCRGWGSVKGWTPGGVPIFRYFIISFLKNVLSGFKKNVLRWVFEKLRVLKKMCFVGVE